MAPKSRVAASTNGLPPLHDAAAAAARWLCDCEEAGDAGFKPVAVRVCDWSRGDPGSDDNLSFAHLARQAERAADVLAGIVGDDDAAGRAELISYLRLSSTAIKLYCERVLQHQRASMVSWAAVRRDRRLQPTANVAGPEWTGLLLQGEVSEVKLESFQPTWPGWAAWQEEVSTSACGSVNGREYQWWRRHHRIALPAPLLALHHLTMQAAEPACGPVSSSALALLELMLEDVHESLAATAAGFFIHQEGHGTRAITLSSRDVQTAVRVFLPGELAKHAVSEATKAVTKFTSI